MKQLLTYYSSYRASCDDTQDLYLGFEEAKPLISLINKIQIEMKENILMYGEESCNHNINSEVQTLSDRLIDVLAEDVISDLKQKKLIK